MTQSAFKKTGQSDEKELKPVFYFHIHSNQNSFIHLGPNPATTIKKSISSYPATEHQNPFYFSRPGAIHLYQVHGFEMGVIK